jgi:kumamolisin
MGDDKTFKPLYLMKEKLSTVQSRSTRPWFYGNEIKNIYNIPTPTNNKYVVSVVSFGGGLFGTITGNTNSATGGTLTNGDIQAYWSSLNITSMPTVIIKTISGATNNISDFDSSVENTIDVESIGMCCPTSNLTIVLYLVPNALSSFPIVLNAILNDTTYVSNCVSISWGTTESNYGNNYLTQINNVLASIVAKNINITVASGDNGSSDGAPGNNCDFPSSSPNVIACGGTKLICPNYTYDVSTKETAWTSGGGGISKFFSKPSYQSKLSGNYRLTPDLSLVADPNTAVLYIINGSSYIVGGTSIVAPMVAGILASCYTTKFINPIIYKSGLLCFNDIRSGSNGAYTAKVGYDNCTGYGSLKSNILNQIINYNVSINSTLSLAKNTKKTISITSNYNYKSYYTWSSNNTSVATVNSSGVVSGIKSGTSTITLNTVNPYISKTITVTVTNINRVLLYIKSNKYKKY